MFDGLPVSEKFKEKIETAIACGKLSHAIILEGADSETRLKAAKEIAKAIICTSSDSVPCGVCAGCRKADSMSHPDIHFLFKEDASANIKVDQIRLLKRDAALLPNDCEKSVFIVSEAQYMNPQAQNALLKILEEPADYVTFILTCNSKSAFLETIISRATDYILSSEEENQTDESFLEALASARDLISCLCKKTEFDFLCMTADFQKDKQKAADLLSALYNLFADSLSYKNAVRDKLNASELNTAKLLCESFTERKLFEFLKATQSLNENFNSSANYNLLITRLCSVYYEIKLH